MFFFIFRFSLFSERAVEKQANDADFADDFEEFVNRLGFISQHDDLVARHEVNHFGFAARFL